MASEAEVPQNTGVTGRRTLMADPAIVVKNLTVAFGQRTVIDKISFEVPRGTTLVIIGLSGVGKSTILRCLTGLLKPTGGEVFINNQDISKLKVKELTQLRRRIGMAFQRAALFDSMSVGENVAFGLREHTKLSNDEIHRIVAEKLKVVDLEGMADHFPSELSGGMQKRASFARTVATDPDLIFYDEPTTGLDPIITRVINQLMLDIQTASQATSVVVTHDLAGALMVGHKLMMLHEGRIVWMGRAEEFESTTNPYIVQFREGRADGPIKV
jgi:phospholipid/cholesterol/gamma-HCH transport system ATP-binding protein